MRRSIPPSYLCGIWKLQPGDSWLSKMPNYSFNTQRTAVQQKQLKPSFLWPTNIFILVLLLHVKRLTNLFWFVGLQTNWQNNSCICKYIHDKLMKYRNINNIVFLCVCMDAARWIGGRLMSAIWSMEPMVLFSIRSSLRMRRSTCSPPTCAGECTVWQTAKKHIVRRIIMSTCSRAWTKSRSK